MSKCEDMDQEPGTSSKSSKLTHRTRREFLEQKAKTQLSKLSKPEHKEQNKDTYTEDDALRVYIAEALSKIKKISHRKDVKKRRQKVRPDRNVNVNQKSPSVKLPPIGHNEEHVLTKNEAAMYRHIKSVYVEDSTKFKQNRQQGFFTKLEHIQLDVWRLKHEEYKTKQFKKVESTLRQQEQLRQLRERFTEEQVQRFRSQYVTSRILEHEWINRYVYGLPEELYDEQHSLTKLKDHPKRPKDKIHTEVLRNKNKEKFLKVFDVTSGPEWNKYTKPPKMEGIGELEWEDTETSSDGSKGKRQKVKHVVAEAQEILKALLDMEDNMEVPTLGDFPKDKISPKPNNVTKSEPTRPKKITPKKGSLVKNNKTVDDDIGVEDKSPTNKAHTRLVSVYMNQRGTPQRKGRVVIAKKYPLPKIRNKYGNRSKTPNLIATHLKKTVPNMYNKKAYPPISGPEWSRLISPVPQFSPHPPMVKSSLINNTHLKSSAGLGSPYKNQEDEMEIVADPVRENAGIESGKFSIQQDYKTNEEGESGARVIQETPPVPTLQKDVMTHGALQQSNDIGGNELIKKPLLSQSDNSGTPHGNPMQGKTTNNGSMKETQMEPVPLSGEQVPNKTIINEPKSKNSPIDATNKNESTSMNRPFKVTKNKTVTVPLLDEQISNKAITSKHKDQGKLIEDVTINNKQPLTNGPLTTNTPESVPDLGQIYPNKTNEPKAKSKPTEATIKRDSALIKGSLKDTQNETMPFLDEPIPNKFRTNEPKTHSKPTEATTEGESALTTESLKETQKNPEPFLDETIPNKTRTKDPKVHSKPTEVTTKREPALAKGSLKVNKTGPGHILDEPIPNKNRINETKAQNKPIEVTTNNELALTKGTPKVSKKEPVPLLDKPVSNKTVINKQKQKVQNKPIEATKNEGTINLLTNKEQPQNPQKNFATKPEEAKMNKQINKTFQKSPPPSIFRDDKSSQSKLTKRDPVKIIRQTPTERDKRDLDPLDLLSDSDDDDDDDDIFERARKKYGIVLDSDGEPD